MGETASSCCGWRARLTGRGPLAGACWWEVFSARVLQIMGPRWRQAARPCAGEAAFSKVRQRAARVDAFSHGRVSRGGHGRCPIATYRLRRWGVLAILVGHNANFCTVDDLAVLPLLLLQNMEDDLVQRALSNAVVHVHKALLTYSVNTVFCLQKSSRDPVELGEHDGLRRGEGEAVAAGRDAHEGRPHLRPLLEAVHQGTAAVPRRPPVDEDVGDPPA
mmetsp:Transcript_19639/g.61772  ORF Transcript_19639/g.61772 Transcript_19639/m.61772 type:complete len:219 (-) Transcript_19639:377-1033(-)